MKMNRFEFIAMNSPIRRFIQKHIEIKGFDVPNNLKDKVVLEIGCGSGYGTALIKEYFQPKKIYGIDIDEKMISLANSRKIQNAIFKIGDATKLPFKDESFDTIFDFGILHHIPNWRKALDEVSRVLKPNGQLFIEDLSIETFETPLGRIIKKFTDHPYSSMYNSKEFFTYLKPRFKTTFKGIYNPLCLITYFVYIGKKVYF